MKLNKKGFTLIELLAVVVIMLAISVMAISSISAAIERNKAKQDNAKKETIVSIVKLYYDEHKNSLETSGCIPLSKLDLTDNEIKCDQCNDGKSGTFSGGVKYENGNNFEYVDKCPKPKEE